MTGPEHYLAAEALIRHSKNHVDQGNDADDMIAILTAAQAQVHATLSLAAAQADLVADRYVGDGDHINAWRAVTS